MENLRIATQEEQIQNSTGVIKGTKKARQYNAKPLPEGITQDMLPMYVHYYTEDKPKRSFWKVDGHPNLPLYVDPETNERKRKIWIGSKSSKISIYDRLQEAIKVVQNLDNGIVPVKKEKALPDYFRIEGKTKQNLLFEKRKPDSVRLNMRMVLPNEYDIQEQFSIFLEKLQKKYPEEDFSNAQSFFDD
jgi:hypothetical protein